MSSYPGGFPIKYASWKGRPFYQVVASIQKNLNNAPLLSVRQLGRPLPLSIYRREIHNIRGQTLPKNCNARISVKIADFETPGNNLVSERQQSFTNGLVNTLDINPTTLSAENGACNNATACFLSPQQNARKRCRSSGMIPRRFNVNKNNDTYATSTQQYLTSRNRTIKQNEYVYIRKGSSGLIPGPGLAASNIYSPGGLSHCYQPEISAANNNNRFSYVWADGGTYTATIPDGQYSVEQLNQVFQNIQVSNGTYLVGPNSARVFLMNISYDTNTQLVVLYAGVTSQADCTTNSYTQPGGVTWFSGRTISNYFPATNPTPVAGSYTAGATYFIVPQYTLFSNLIGFAPGTYFGGINQSAFRGDITPNYVALYYKPNNPGFGVQGAVESSTRMLRLKYNTVTNSAGGVRSAYGNATANALAYGVSEQAYTAKTQVGDKPIKTPVINPRTGQLCQKTFIYRM
jgi:hypothetical protein